MQLFIQNFPVQTLSELQQHWVSQENCTEHKERNFQNSELQLRPHQVYKRPGEALLKLSQVTYQADRKGKKNHPQKTNFTVTAAKQGFRFHLPG